MIVRGIESSCDDTAAAVVKDGRKILSNVVSSQIDFHKKYGGVVPEIASRKHVESILPVIKEALESAKLTLDDIEGIAVTRGPGLVGSLLIGISVAKSISYVKKLPLIGINHIEAHLYAPFMDNEIPLPALGVVVSGGHTSLILIEAIGEYRLIGETIDDAVGEAFDKVAKMLGLPYPGGPEIERLAKAGDPGRYSFRAGRVKEKPFHFSFSGLKTAVLYRWRELDDSEKPHIAASFQEAALSDVAKKAIRAAKEFGCQAIVTGGGVTHNQRLKELLEEASAPVYWPGPGLSLDNAAMIAGLGYHQLAQQGEDSLSIRPQTRIPLAN